MHLIQVPSMLLGFLDTGDFGMTALSYQRGKWGKHFSMFCPNISIVLDHDQNLWRSRRCNCKDCSHFEWLWLYVSPCEDKHKVFCFMSAEFWCGDVDLQACILQPLKDLSQMITMVIQTCFGDAWQIIQINSSRELLGYNKLWFLCLKNDRRTCNTHL